MITYKNITDVEVLNEMPEGATALVNDGGELKQVGCEKFGGKKEIAGRTLALYCNNYDSATSNLTYEEFDNLFDSKKIEGITIFINHDGYYVISKCYGFSKGSDYWAFNSEDGSIAIHLYNDNHIELVSAPK